MRREADNVGPKAELDHWKKRMAKFNSLLDQIKSPDCKTVTGILITAKSKVIKVMCFVLSFNAVFSGKIFIYCLKEQNN